jgi:hypothetical protein
MQRRVEASGPAGGLIVVGAGQVPAAQICTPEIGSPKVGTLQVGTPQARGAQAGVSQVRTPQKSVPQSRAVHGGSLKIRVAQIGEAPALDRYDGFGQVCTGEVGVLEMCS